MKTRCLKHISVISICFMILLIAKTAACGFQKGHYSNPEVDISWQGALSASKRLQLTGQLRNVSMHDQLNIELRVRVSGENGKLLGNAIFKFIPSLVHPDVMLPFGMMIDLPDADSVSTADFDLYYEVVTQDKVLLPQFIQFTGDLRLIKP